jgi:hypothetical protein
MQVSKELHTLLAQLASNPGDQTTLDHWMHSWTTSCDRPSPLMPIARTGRESACGCRPLTPITPNQADAGPIAGHGEVQARLRRGAQGNAGRAN